VGFRRVGWHDHLPVERSANVTGGTADMNVHRKSDGPIVPAKRANKAGTPAAESVEERGSPKGNAARCGLAPDTAPAETQGIVVGGYGRSR
jgi:hypothetical protein